VSRCPASSISKWFGDPETFRDWRGEKKCGGFHPDYTVEWKKGAESVAVLICLSCHEIKAYLGRRAVRLDVNTKAYNHVRQLLAPSREKGSYKNGVGE
jgi:hypothetical protein